MTASTPLLRRSSMLQSRGQRYAALYAEAYSREESVAELIPAMLTAFLESDRAFAKACKTAEE